MVVEKAKEDAEKQWMEKEGTTLESSKDVRKVLVERYHPSKNRGWWPMKLRKWEDILDFVVDSVIE